MATRTPDKMQPAAAFRLKSLFRKSYEKRKGVSLKQFVRESEDKEVRELAPRWFHNKSANASNPPKGIGSTRKKKKRQG